LVKGKRVLVVEDLTTTGMSVKKVVDRVKEAGGKVISVFILVNRNPKDINSKFMGASLKSLSIFKADAYDEDKCPLCKKNIPINTEVGHGKEYIARKK
jgi:orotate phosphoribosyltransferase